MCSQAGELEIKTLNTIENIVFKSKTDLKFIQMKCRKKIDKFLFY